MRTKCVLVLQRYLIDDKTSYDILLLNVFFLEGGLSHEKLYYF